MAYINKGLEKKLFYNKGIKVKKLLGQGGEAHVFLGSLENQDIVIKNYILNCEFSQNEYDILTQLNHPQIPMPKMFFEIKEFKILINQYIKGDRLNYAQISNSQVPQIYQGCLEILRYLNSQNIVHRDIKPDNIIIDKNSKPHLIDFSAAAKIGSIAPNHGSKYSNPDKKQFNPKDDIDSLNKVFLELFNYAA